MFLLLPVDRIVRDIAQPIRGLNLVLALILQLISIHLLHNHQQMLQPIQREMMKCPQVKVQAT